MKKNNFSSLKIQTKKMFLKKTKSLLSLALLLGFSICVNAQNLAAGIDGATGEVKGIFSNVSTLILAIGGIVGLVGGIRVYIKWNNGDQDVQKELIGWAGACVFLLISGVVVKTFFGM